MASSIFIHREKGEWHSEGLREVWEGEMSLVVAGNTVYGNKMVCNSNKKASTTVSILPSGQADFTLIN